MLKEWMKSLTIWQHFDSRSITSFDNIFTNKIRVRNGGKRSSLKHVLHIFNHSQSVPITRLMKNKTYINLPCGSLHAVQNVVLARVSVPKNWCTSRLAIFFKYSRVHLFTLQFFFLASVNAGLVGSVCEVLLREMWIDGMLCLEREKKLFFK